MTKELTFLVILDDTLEMYNALRYAAQRSARSNGRVAILYTFDTLEFSHWKAVEDIAEAESREKAESKIQEYENFIMSFSSKKPKKFLKPTKSLIVKGIGIKVLDSTSSSAEYLTLKLGLGRSALLKKETAKRKNKLIFNL